MTHLSHVMIDLETMGTVPGCLILSIGAVEFFPHTQELGREFYIPISRADSLENFLEEDPDTKAWWAKQSTEARKVIQAADAEDAPPLASAMSKLNGWMNSVGPKNSIRLYGNGADFDNPILRVAYKCANVEPYAGAWGGRCYRTLKNLDELLGPQFAFSKVDREGIHHNALDDAKSQAKHLMANIADIRTKVYIDEGE